jgi:hypothetical protein
MPLDKTENMFYYISGCKTLQIFIAGRSIFNNRIEFCTSFALQVCHRQPFWCASVSSWLDLPVGGNGWVSNSSISLHPCSHSASEKTLLFLAGCMGKTSKFGDFQSLKIHVCRYLNALAKNLPCWASGIVCYPSNERKLSFSSKLIVLFLVLTE